MAMGLPTMGLRPITTALRPASKAVALFHALYGLPPIATILGGTRFVDVFPKVTDGEFSFSDQSRVVTPVDVPLARITSRTIRRLLRLRPARAIIASLSVQVRQDALGAFACIDLYGACRLHRQTSATLGRTSGVFLFVRLQLGQSFGWGRHPSSVLCVVSTDRSARPSDSRGPRLHDMPPIRDKHSRAVRNGRFGQICPEPEVPKRS
jgi:hypothetical protein